MKNIKPLSALLAAAMLCGLAGCARDEGTSSEPESSEASQSVSTVVSQDNSESNSQNTSQNTSQSTSSSVPGNISDNSAASSQPSESTQYEIDNIEMDEQPISLPCKVKDIKNITIERGRFFSVKQRDNGEYMSSSYFDYNGVRAGQIYLEGKCSQKPDLSEEKVIGLVAGNSSVPVSYMGLTYNSDKTEIIRVLGEPEKDDDQYMYYLIEPEGSVTFSLNSENKVTDIAIFLNIR